MATDTRLISVVGKKHSGKTTLVVALAAEHKRRGRRVATIKHGTHPANVDERGTDTWRHYHEGLADRVLIEAPRGRVIFERTDQECDPFALARRFMTGMDLVIVEGFTAHALPKIEVFRRSEHPEPHYHPSHQHASRWVAMVTDGESIEVPFPVFRFSDTEWLMAIAEIAWAKAIPLGE